MQKKIDRASTSFQLIRLDVTNNDIHMPLDHIKFPTEVKGKLSISTTSDDKKGAFRKKKALCSILVRNARNSIIVITKQYGH